LADVNFLHYAKFMHFDAFQHFKVYLILTGIPSYFIFFYDRLNVKKYFIFLKKLYDRLKGN